MTDSKNNPLLKTKGRGASANTAGRFESLSHETDLENYGWFDEEDQKTLKTQFFKDTSRTIVTENKSPDIIFRYSMNFYRGCEHGCAYCYARPTHEYLGLSAGLDFESKIFVKEAAPELLREKLMSPRWEPETIHINGITDCYQPIERKLELTRRCLQVLAEFRNPLSIITKNQLITRDIDIFKDLAADQTVFLMLSITTLDESLARKLEPRTSSPQGRLKAIEELAKAGIPVGVNIAPVIPGLNDHEIPVILKAASEAGAKTAGCTPLRLPYSVKDVFSEWLTTHKPDAKEKVLNSIRSMRGGELNDSNFETRMQGTGARADHIANIFDIFSRKYGFNRERVHLAKDKFRRPGEQLKLL